MAGRFQPGKSGNPKGKPKGSRNHVLAALDAIGGKQIDRRPYKFLPAFEARALAEARAGGHRFAIGGGLPMVGCMDARPGA